MFRRGHLPSRCTIAALAFTVLFTFALISNANKVAAERGVIGFGGLLESKEIPTGEPVVFYGSVLNTEPAPADIASMRVFLQTYDLASGENVTLDSDISDSDSVLEQNNSRSYRSTHVIDAPSGNYNLTIAFFVKAGAFQDYVYALRGLNVTLYKPSEGFLSAFEIVMIIFGLVLFAVGILTYPKIREYFRRRRNMRT